MKKNEITLQAQIMAKRGGKIYTIEKLNTITNNGIKELSEAILVDSEGKEKPVAVSTLLKSYERCYESFTEVKNQLENEVAEPQEQAQVAEPQEQAQVAEPQEPQKVTFDQIESLAKTRFSEFTVDSPRVHIKNAVYIGLTPQKKDWIIEAYFKPQKNQIELWVHSKLYEAMLDEHAATAMRGEDRHNRGYCSLIAYDLNTVSWDTILDTVELHIGSIAKYEKPSKKKAEETSKKTDEKLEQAKQSSKERKAKEDILAMAYCGKLFSECNEDEQAHISAEVIDAQG